MEEHNGRIMSEPREHALPLGEQSDEEDNDFENYDINCEKNANSPLAEAENGEPRVKSATSENESLAGSNAREDAVRDGRSLIADDNCNTDDGVDNKTDVYSLFLNNAASRASDDAEEDEEEEDADREPKACTTYDDDDCEDKDDGTAGESRGSANSPDPSTTRFALPEKGDVGLSDIHFMCRQTFSDEDYQQRQEREEPVGQKNIREKSTVLTGVASIVKLEPVTYQSTGEAAEKHDIAALLPGHATGDMKVQTNIVEKTRISDAPRSRAMLESSARDALDASSSSSLRHKSFDETAARGKEVDQPSENIDKYRIMGNKREREDDESEEGRPTTDIASASTMLLNKKRKTTALSINLLQFMTILWKVYMDTKVDSRLLKIIIPHNILDYMKPSEEASSTKTTTTTAASNAAVVTSGVNENADITKANDQKSINKQSLMMRILLQTMKTLESVNASFQFSKETLKYFLATHSRFVLPSDFIDTNTLTKSEKKNKNNTPLLAGGILVEYAKGFDSFVSNMSRADKSDIKALRFIIDRKIELSPKIYSSLRNIKFTDAKYEIDQKNTVREGYVKIPSLNFKRATILITGEIVMVYDGCHFVIPPMSIEKDIQMGTILKSSLRKNEYILLDMLLSTKNKVLDLIDAKIEGFVVPNNYLERLLFVSSRLSDLKCMTATNENIDTSYIQKKLTGHGVSFIYNKPNITVAVVGVCDKHACIAFKKDDHTLIVKTKCSIAGPTVYLITTASFQQNSPSITERTIVHNDRVYKVLGDLEKVRFFTRAITIEMRDGNKLGCLSTYEISNMCDYKPPTMPKDIVNMDSVNQVINNNRDHLVEMITRSVHYDDIFEKLEQRRSAQMDINFGTF